MSGNGRVASGKYMKYWYQVKVGDGEPKNILAWSPKEAAIEIVKGLAPKGPAKNVIEYLKANNLPLPEAKELEPTKIMVIPLRAFEYSLEADGSVVG